MRWLLLILLLSSCGARKSEVHKTETESKSETEIARQNDVVTEATTETITESEFESVTIIPVDPTRPIEILRPDGTKTTITNARIEKKKAKQEIKQNTAVKATDKSKAVVKHQEESKSVTKDKVTEREAVKFPWWGWLVLVISGYFMYRYIVRK